jgi:hypothetical protein
VAVKELSASIAIKSTPAKIWSILTDAGAYPSWNTTMTKLEGTIALGEKLKIHAKLSPDRPFPVRVAELEPDKRMVWRGGMPIGFLFKGERTFTLTPGADDTVELRMREVFTGLFSPLIEKSIPDLQPAFEEFAACLKRRAES